MDAGGANASNLNSGGSESGASDPAVQKGKMSPKAKVANEA